MDTKISLYEQTKILKKIEKIRRLLNNKFKRTWKVILIFGLTPPASSTNVKACRSKPNIMKRITNLFISNGSEPENL